MIYLEETLNLEHASPEALDAYIEFAQRLLVPVCPEVGARLIAAWTSNEEWFCQVKQVMEFADLDALKAFRVRSSQNSGWGAYAAGLEDHAPVRRSRLLEPLDGVPQRLDRAIDESREHPVNGYLHAILEVAPGMMGEFRSALSATPQTSPIIATWRPIGGSPNEIIDVWKSPQPPAAAYASAEESARQFFKRVRELAPRERAVRMVSLPYSPLK